MSPPLVNVMIKVTAPVASDCSTATAECFPCFRPPTGSQLNKDQNPLQKLRNPTCCRYPMHIESHAWTTNTKQKMACGSVFVSHKLEYYEWFTRALKPGVHFVEVDPETICVDTATKVSCHRHCGDAGDPSPHPTPPPLSPPRGCPHGRWRNHPRVALVLFGSESTCACEED